MVDADRMFRWAHFKKFVEIGPGLVSISPHNNRR